MINNRNADSRCPNCGYENNPPDEWCICDEVPDAMRGHLQYWMRRAERAEAERTNIALERDGYATRAEVFKRERDEALTVLRSMTTERDGALDAADRYLKRLRIVEQRGEKAEALLRELAVAAMDVPVELGRRLDEWQITDDTPELGASDD